MHWSWPTLSGLVAGFVLTHDAADLERLCGGLIERADSWDLICRQVYSAVVRADTKQGVRAGPHIVSG